MTDQKFTQHHTEAWRRCIFDACGDRRVADRAIEMAILNGLFDLHREAGEIRRLAHDGRISNEVIGLRVRNILSDDGEEQGR